MHQTGLRRYRECGEFPSDALEYAEPVRRKWPGERLRTRGKENGRRRAPERDPKEVDQTWSYRRLLKLIVFLWSATDPTRRMLAQVPL